MHCLVLTKVFGRVAKGLAFGRGFSMVWLASEALACKTESFWTLCSCGGVLGEGDCAGSLETRLVIYLIITRLLNASALKSNAPIKTCPDSGSAVPSKVENFLSGQTY